MRQIRGAIGPTGRLRDGLDRSVDFLNEQRCNLLTARSYFDRSLVCREDVRWLLILTFPNGGSTALAKLLLTAPSTARLTGNAEGQWLIPSLSKNISRWDQTHVVPHRKLRAVWLNEVKKRKGRKSTLVVEKSPTNMCRYKDILDALSGMKTYTITFTRDPYATCASWHRRYGLENILKEWCAGDKSEFSTEEDYYKLLGKIWLNRAKMLIDARSDSVIDIKYEDFADNTKEVIDLISLKIPELENISHDTKISVKDYADQEIKNMNKGQIDTLSSDQISAITSSLSEHPDTVSRLGYDLI